jgi:hypothetical protein
MMRRAPLVVTMMAVSLLAASEVALAINRIGTDGPDTLREQPGTTTTPSCPNSLWEGQGA